MTRASGGGGAGWIWVALDGGGLEVLALEEAGILFRLGTEDPFEFGLDDVAVGGGDDEGAATALVMDDEVSVGGPEGVGPTLDGAADAGRDARDRAERDFSERQVEEENAEEVAADPVGDSRAEPEEGDENHRQRAGTDLDQEFTHEWSCDVTVPRVRRRVPKAPRGAAQAVGLEIF